MLKAPPKAVELPLVTRRLGGDGTGFSHGEVNYRPACRVCSNMLDNDKKTGKWSQRQYSSSKSCLRGFVKGETGESCMRDEGTDK